jgi:hypothetical protein
VAFDRLLARLLIAAPDRWLLKGALALDYRLGARFRTTKDLDLSREDNEAEATDDLLAAQELDLNDYFAFTPAKATRRGPATSGAAIRYSLTAQLAGYRFESFAMDVSFSDPRFASPEILHGPGLLRFADIDPVEVPAIPIEQQVAEKMHAYIRVYPGEHRSSRAKDLIDLVLVQGSLQVNAGRLNDALEITFAGREGRPVPGAVPTPPANWLETYGAMAREVDLSMNPIDGYRLVTDFLGPILAGRISENATWNPRSRRWE